MARQQIENLLNFLEPFLGFANCHMVDYFTNSCYKNYIPADIRREVDEIGINNVPELIFQNDFHAAPNLANFVQNSVKFTLNNSDICTPIDGFVKQMQSRGCDVDRFKLEIFMTPKKSHEVEILSGVAASISQLTRTSHLVDVGDGKGYLSSMLALRNKIPVLGIDASNANTCGAIKRVTKLSKIWNNIPDAPFKSVPKKTENFCANCELYKQVTEFVDENFNLEKLVVDTFQTVQSVRIGLVGLHTCGDLAPHSLKLFIKNDSVKSICNVGCCYHLLSEASETESDHFGFPMSRFLVEKKFHVGRSARMIANQSVDRILESKELPNVTIFYRAVLQVILETFCQELPTKHVGKFRKRPKSFCDYVRTALARINAQIEISDYQIDQIYAKYEDRLSELNVFYLLRCKLSPVIESLILLDRLLFLEEKGFCNSFLVQFFDPVVSPRCYGIVAFKENAIES